MAKIDAFFNHMMEEGGSDLHLSAGVKPLLRKDGELTEIPFKYDFLTNDMLKELLSEIATPLQWENFQKNKDLDFAYEIPGKARFRANYMYQKRGIGAVFRIIPEQILTVEQLGLPPQVLNFANYSRGLILVTGATGSGKSTTLAGIIDYINRTRADHILTVEDPVEFVHRPQKCLVNHREVRAHTESFATALKAALREDPDVILVGEMRDLETIELAITAAETGHLVFGTLHTNSAAKTVDRIIDVFPTARQAQIRAMLSESLKGVICQNLFKRVDKGGRVAALEILFVTGAIANLIREGKTFQIPSSIQTGRGEGMQLMDQAIKDHLEAGIISPEEAYSKCFDKKTFAKYLKEKPEDSGE
ncbi:type IV pilus twitching motility protein PilT [Limisalsivibrio acetivorans]|uniref:type IV pilus twitching motility protein PilT n=1 Tax=Limisalsivibrio acetivorans TaxID=1304888 RepID=UPI0003B692CD|nr:type IV pilus twitching motility protein PilT [Limisalsivibrio acetivorans]